MQMSLRQFVFPGSVRRKQEKNIKQMGSTIFPVNNLMITPNISKQCNVA